MTKAVAQAIYKTGFWHDLTAVEIAAFQLKEDLLCMPFGVFQDALSEALDRSVFTHEFANQDGLIAEFNAKLEDVK